MSTRAAPVVGEVAIAGQDGRLLSKLLGQSKAYGVRTMAELVRGAVARYRGFGPLLDTQEIARLGLALAAVNSTAELLGRSRVREQAERATVPGLREFSDAPFSTFADEPPGVMRTPEEAVAFFMSRRPELGIDPDRFGELQRRQAFTLARSANLYLTQRVQQIVGKAMRLNRSPAEAAAQIRTALEGAGVSPRNPQYSEMVFRTNAMDAFVQGHFDEGHAEEDTFPVWQYLGIDDERAGVDHKPKFDKYYPRSAAFATVRGNRPFNCRCGLKWIDREEWDELKRTGAEVESKW